jgi:hypothetical protein
MIKRELASEQAEEIANLMKRAADADRMIKQSDNRGKRLNYQEMMPKRTGGTKPERRMER